MVFAALPPQCAKMLGKDPPPEEPLIAPPPSVPITSATTPPIWKPPDTASTASTGPPPNPDLVKAKAAAEAKDWKRVKQLLEKKLKSGKATSEEIAVVKEACTAV